MRIVLLGSPSLVFLNCFCLLISDVMCLFFGLCYFISQMLYFFLYKIKTLRLLPLRICHIFFCYNDNKRSRMKNMKRKKKYVSNFFTLKNSLRCLPQRLSWSHQIWHVRYHKKLGLGLGIGFEASWVWTICGAPI